MGRVEGKVALVTGGASGIGAACAATLAREGAPVVITDVQDAKGEALAAAIGKAGGAAGYLHHDVTSEDAWIEIIAEIERRTAGWTCWSTTPASASAARRSPP